jgi:predicted kinase
MRDDTPTVYLLAGLPGSGKTYAKALESEGVVRLAVDEPSPASPDRVAAGRAGGGPGDEINRQLVAHLEAGRDVVLDHGLAEPEQREFYKHLVEDHGGQWCLIHFTVDHTDLIRRLGERVGVRD